MIYHDGSRFEGHFVLNSRCGHNCIFTLTDGSEYRGDFANDKMHGDGVMTFANGTRYEGQWERGEMHGVGSLTLADGTVVQGTWVRGKLARREAHSTLLVSSPSQPDSQSPDATATLDARREHWDLKGVTTIQPEQQQQLAKSKPPE
jgi:hypothetical protein